MKKCTLCIDRIYNETMAPEDRIPACVARLPDRRAPFRGPGRSTERGVAAGQRARRLRPAARVRLPARQQVPAAAGRASTMTMLRRGPRAAGCRRCCARLDPRPVLRPGSTRRSRANTRSARCIRLISVIVFTTASGAGYGLLIWLSAGVAAWSATADAATGICRLGARARAGHRGPCSSSMLHLGRPERALACAVAMALVVAVAGGTGARRRPICRQAHWASAGRVRRDHRGQTRDGGLVPQFFAHCLRSISPA